MEKVLKAIGAMFVFSAVVIVAAPFNAACGALAGLTVGVVFGDTITNVLSILGVHDVQLWQLGATLGFCSGFLRTQTTVKSEKQS